MYTYTDMRTHIKKHTHTHTLPRKTTNTCTPTHLGTKLTEREWPTNRYTQTEKQTHEAGREREIGRQTDRHIGRLQLWDNHQ